MILTAWLGIDPQLITAVCAGAAAIIGAINVRKITRTEGKIEVVRQTAHATYVLSNSAMAAQLLTNVELLTELSVQAHRFAELTKEPGDAAAALAFDVKIEAAKVLYREHLARQTIVDAIAKRRGSK